MKRIGPATLFAVWLALVAPAGALGAGGPVPPLQSTDIAVPDSPYRYAAFDAGRETTVRQIEAGADRTASTLRVAGHYGVPGVDYTDSTTGLSADGRTLILAEMFGNGPPRTTRLLVLATLPRLAIRARIALAGWSTVDAISPDGWWLYLIHYTSADVLKYEVRAYDLRTHRLLARPVVDPREPDEAMAGIPAARVMSAGGRWAYTLYMRPSGVPFIHALDTADRRAVCVDLPSLANVEIGSTRLRLPPGGGVLQVVDAGGATQAQINTETFVVRTGPGHARSASAPSAAAPSAAAHSAAKPSRPGRHRPRTVHHGGGLPWEIVAVMIGLLGVFAAFIALPARTTRPRSSDQDARQTISF
jgi:hypothetical protein